MRLDFAGGNVQYRTVWHLGTIIMMCGVFNGGSQGRHTTSSSPDSKSLQPCPGIYCNIQGSLSLCPCGDGELFGDEKRRHWLLQPSCVWYLLLLNACKALPCNIWWLNSTNPEGFEVQGAGTCQTPGTKFYFRRLPQTLYKSKLKIQLVNYNYRN